MGVSVTLFLPLYRQIDQLSHMIKDIGVEISVPISERQEKARIYQAHRDGMTVYFIAHDGYFNRQALY
jgi:hypothetical protein